MDGLEFFTGDDEQHYWRLRSPKNGKIIAVGGEGYSSKGAAEHGFASTRALILSGAAADAEKQAETLAANTQPDATT